MVDTLENVPECRHRLIDADGSWRCESAIVAWGGQRGRRVVLPLICQQCQVANIGPSTGTGPGDAIIAAAEDVDGRTKVLHQLLAAKPQRRFRVPLEVAQQRLAACESCEHWRPCHTCGVGQTVGCHHPQRATRIILSQIALDYLQCPIGKWTVETPFSAKPNPPGHACADSRLPATAGVAIGSWNLPKLVELQILLIRQHCGHVPILIADDTDRGGQPEKFSALAELEQKYDCVEFWPNENNKGHHAGDASVFWKALQWGHVRKLDYVAKLSMRFLINQPNWLAEAVSELAASGKAIASSPCRDNGCQLFIRSEAVILKVQPWITTGAWRGFAERASLAPVAELHYNHLIHAYFGGQMHRWSLLRENRTERMNNIVWHCANSRSDYEAIARQLGISLDHDFHVGGSRDGKGFAQGYKIG